jgi:hypothetical protein
MSKEDCSSNRFNTLKETKKNPFLSKKKFENQESQNTQPQNTRWSNLSQDEYRDEESRSPKNSFRRRSRDNFDKRPYGKDTDRYGNYRGSRFRKETRPKTPPPKKFKMEENDFPPLG